MTYTAVASNICLQHDTYMKLLSNGAVMETFRREILGRRRNIATSLRAKVVSLRCFDQKYPKRNPVQTAKENIPRP